MNKTVARASKISVYQKVTDAILKRIDEDGALPWHKPWKVSLNMNFISGRPYRGLNQILTGMQGFGSPYWMTAKQIKAKGGTWSGSGTLITFWKWLDVKKKNENGIEETDRIPFLRYYYVWNAEQIEGIEFPEAKEVNFSNELAEEYFANYLAERGPELKVMTSNQAYYHPKLDHVVMPRLEQFDSSCYYYHVMAHEMIHSTGHGKRLDRNLTEGVMTKESYAKEELVAEMGASFVSAKLGLTCGMENSIAYLKGWRDRIAKDEKLIIQASGLAQKAVDYIEGVTWD